MKILRFDHERTSADVVISGVYNHIDDLQANLTTGQCKRFCAHYACLFPQKKRKKEEKFGSLVMLGRRRLDTSWICLEGSAQIGLSPCIRYV